MTIPPSVRYCSRCSPLPSFGKELGRFTVCIYAFLRFGDDNHTIFLVILGGAGIGSSVGIVAHNARTVLGDRPPEFAIPSLPNESRGDLST